MTLKRNKSKYLILYLKSEKNGTKSFFLLEKWYPEMSVVYHLHEFLNDPGGFIVIKKA